MLERKLSLTSRCWRSELKGVCTVRNTARHEGDHRYAEGRLGWDSSRCFGAPHGASA